MATTKFSILIRCLNTSSITTQMVKPPIQVFGTEGRYATALYSAATKENKLDSVEKELVMFQTTIQKDEKLREFVLNPTIKRQTKSEAIKAIASKLSLSSQSSNLLQLLAENGRLKNFDAIINSFKVIMAAHRGEVTCEVITARELDASQKQQLEQVLKSFLKQKESLVLSTKVDQSIVGGMIVSIGDKYVDMSVASKIKKYTDIIKAAV
ncbi:ATP synthase subunit O, mitochondrial [Agrilus planipennis]|uniref:Oligomycin sensitivity conferral protein n=1 Tax=Agrilus planipennis TaxID=224129 RepID=A0A1W4X734_AGRPL|nr:ATP synthase subunit O, mitochondrial [Agrilus planipennis]